MDELAHSKRLFLENSRFFKILLRRPSIRGFYFNVNVHMSGVVRDKGEGSRDSLRVAGDDREGGVHEADAVVDEAVEAEGEGGGDGGGDAGGWGLEDLDHRAVSVGHEVVVSDVGVSPKD